MYVKGNIWFHDSCTAAALFHYELSKTDLDLELQEICIFGGSKLSVFPKVEFKESTFTFIVSFAGTRVHRINSKN